MDNHSGNRSGYTMRVQKRGERGFEDVKFDKVTQRLQALICEGEYGNTVNAVLIAQQTIKNLYDGITTEELDQIAANIAESRKLLHPNYSQLAGQILISNLHKTTPSRFSVCMQELDTVLHIMSPIYMQFITNNADAIDNMIHNNADYQFGYLAYKTLEKQYLHKVREYVTDNLGKPKYVDFDGNPVEDTEGASANDEFALIAKPLLRYRVHDRPQYMFMRVAIEVAIAGAVNRYCGNNIKGVYESVDNIPAMLQNPQYLPSILSQISVYYNALSKMNFIFATPTNFNACTKFAQLNSCFLLNTDDSIEEIMRTVTNAALISKRAGGIGIAMHKIRCRGAEIKGTNGESSGLIPQIKIYNEDAACWNQGGGKRLGAFAIYIEPWHGDILQFLRLKLTQGEDGQRARNLHYGLWIPDLFMIRARTDALWSLFSEDTAPGLSEVYDGMRVCKRCGYCANRNYIELIRKGVLLASDAGLPAGEVFSDNLSTVDGNGNICARGLTTDVTSLSSIQQCDFHSVNVFTNLYTRYERSGKIVRRVLPSVIINAIAEVQRDQGEPYVCFKDHANRQSNHMNLGTLQSSNLCVAPETYVLTSTGQKRIIDIVGMPVRVWNGCEFTETTPVKTGIAQKLITVNLSNGVSLDCTEYHKFFLPDSKNSDKFNTKRAKNLLPGDILIKYDLPVITRGDIFPRAYERGLSIPSQYSANLTVPMDARIEDKLSWFAGYCDGNGTIKTLGTNYSLQVTNSEKDFLNNIRLMLQTIGIDTTLILSHDVKTTIVAAVNDNDLCHLMISPVELVKLKHLGFKPNQLVIPDQTPQSDASQIITVVSVNDHGRISDTYCFTENNRGMGMFNGVLTGQCTEIFEWHSADQYACCSLASINIKKYLVQVPGESVVNGQSVSSSTSRWTLNKNALISDVGLIVRGLDNIISVNKYPVKECKINAHSYRPIGIGVQGLADVFMIMRIPFISPEAELFDLEIFETIYWAALNASCELAIEIGPYDGFAGSPYSRGELRQDMWLSNQISMREYNNCMIERMDAYNRSGRSSFDWDEMRKRVRGGVRNSLLVALMPTVTTSQLLDNNESFEPVAANIYTKSTLAGKFTMSNNHMINHLIELGLWNDSVKTRVMNNNGSLQSCPEIPADIREIYKTVWEMRQTQIMQRAGLRQAFIDQGQSLNEHITDNSNGVYRGILNIGWELGLNTGNYYIRSRAAVDPMKNNIAAVKESVQPAQGNVPVWDVIATGPACEPGCDSCGS